MFVRQLLAPAASYSKHLRISIAVCLRLFPCLAFSPAPAPAPFVVVVVVVPRVVGCGSVVCVPDLLVVVAYYVRLVFPSPSCLFLPFLTHRPISKAKRLYFRLLLLTLIRISLLLSFLSLSLRSISYRSPKDDILHLLQPPEGNEDHKVVSLSRFCKTNTTKYLQRLFSLFIKPF